MRSPIEELGLHLAADERDIKRAYAQRLRSVRPDEDPDGFQRLNELYKAALNQLRWREEQRPADEVAIAADVADRPSLSLDDVVRREQDEPSQAIADIESVTIDFDAFYNAMTQQAGKDLPAELRAWLARTTADWPLAAKPDMAGYVMWRMREHPPDISVEQFDVIVDGFSLEDVLVNPDGLSLQLLRKQLEANTRRSQFAATMRHVLEPGNEAALVRRMEWTGNGEFASIATRLYAALLRSRNARRLASILRWVPFASAKVNRFLDFLGQGDDGILSPPLDDRVVRYWRLVEERRKAWQPVTVTLVAILLVGLSIYVTSWEGGIQQAQKAGPDRTQPPRSDVVKRETTPFQKAREQRFLERMRQIESMSDGSNAEIAKAYDQIITDLGMPTTPMLQQIATNAYYNKGYRLELLARKAEARQVYHDLDALYAGTRELWHAWGLVNLGNMHLDAAEFDAAITRFQQVIDQYNFTGDVRFDLQVAKSYYGLAKAWQRKPSLDAALQACDAALQQFGRSEDAEIRVEVERIQVTRAAVRKSIDAQD